jgi:hypothetical protein
MRDDEEAKKWLQLGFETYGVDGMLQIADAMGLAPRLERRIRKERRSLHSDRTRLLDGIADRATFVPSKRPYTAGLQLAIASPECIEKCYHLLERPLPYPWSDKNTWDFHRCINECMGLG